MSDKDERTSTSGPAQGVAPSPVKAETVQDFLAGRLALVAARNELRTQSAMLRSELVVVESHLAYAEELLEKADKELEKRYPEAFAQLKASVD